MGIWSNMIIMAQWKFFIANIIQRRKKRHFKSGHNLIIREETNTGMVPL